MGFFHKSSKITHSVCTTKKNTLAPIYKCCTSVVCTEIGKHWCDTTNVSLAYVSIKIFILSLQHFLWPSFWRWR